VTNQRWAWVWTKTNKND